MDWLDQYTYKLAMYKLASLFDDYNYMEKYANTFRDMVAMGRTPKLKGMNRLKSFNILRNKKMYKSFDEYLNMSKLDKETYRQGLIQDLKSMLRGSGKKGKGINQFENFMKNEFVNGDFSRDQYNKFFGNKTHYPSLGRVASGTIKGVYNRADAMNKKIREWNKIRAAKGQELIPEIAITKGSKQLAQAAGIDEAAADLLFGQSGGALTMSVIPDKLKTYDTGKLLPSGLKNDKILIATRSDPLNYWKTTNKVIGEYLPNDPRISGKGTSLAVKASLLDHEFNEALNMVDYVKRYGKKKAYERSILNGSPLMGDSHHSGHVLGNEFMTSNRLYGSQFGNPVHRTRVYFGSYPGYRTGIKLMNSPEFSDYKKILNSMGADDASILRGLSGYNGYPGHTTHTIGMNVSRLDGGFGRFKDPRDFQKYLINNMTRTNDLLHRLSSLVHIYDSGTGIPVPKIETKVPNAIYKMLKRYLPDLRYAPDWGLDALERLRYNSGAWDRAYLRNL